MDFMTLRMTSSGGRSSDKLHLMRKIVGRYLLSIAAQLEIHSNCHYIAIAAKRKQYYYYTH